MTHDLKWSLEDLADADYAEAPPSTIDIAKARHDGRRKMVTARLAPVGAGIAVVAVCGLAVSGIAGGGTTGAAQNPASGNPTSQSTTASKPMPLGSSFTQGSDPLVTRATFGEIPAGWTAGPLQGGSDYGDHVAIHGPGNPADRTTPYVDLMVTAHEKDIWTPTATNEPTTLTGSKTAYFVHFPDTAGTNPSDLALKWQTSSGVWVTLTGVNLGDQEHSKAMLKSLAESVVLGDRAAPLPFHIEGVPQGFAVQNTELNVPALNGTGTGWDVQLELVRGDQSILVSVAPTGQPTHPTAAGTPSEKPPVPSTGGMPPKTHIAMECKDENGLHICVTDPTGDSGAAKDLLERITSLGTDQANWTTHVLH